MMNITSKLYVALSMAIISIPCLGGDDRAWLHLGGISRHNIEGYQEVNQGLGYDIPISAVTRLGAGGYRNSMNRSSSYVALNTTINSTTIVSTAKVKTGVMYGVVSGYSSGYIPVVTPTLAIEHKGYGVMLAYIPAVSGINNSSSIAMQFRVRVM